MSGYPRINGYCLEWSWLQTIAYIAIMYPTILLWKLVAYMNRDKMASSFISFPCYLG